MRILSITAQKPMQTGSGTYLSALLDQYKAMGHAQALVAGIEGDDLVLLPEGVAFFPVYYDSPTLPFRTLGMSDEMPYESTRYRDLGDDQALAFEQAFIKVVGEAIERFKPELILAHHLYFLTALIREAFPDLRIHGLSHGSCLRQLQKTPLQRERIIKNLRKLDGIYVLHEAQRRLVSALLSLDEDLIQVVGTGFDSARFHPLEAPGEAPASGPTRIIYAGKLSKAKGVYSLLRALSLLPTEGLGPLVLDLAGGGDRAPLKALADAAPIPVNFLGRLDPDAMADTFRNSHLMVLPSFYEGLPLVVVEALASGLRTVVTELAGIKPWLSSTVGEDGIFYVTAPQMQAVDEALESELPAFEARLAKAIERAILDVKKTPIFRTDCSVLSWRRVALALLP